MFFGNFVKPRRSEKKSPDTTGDFDGRYKSVDVFVLINSEETAFGNPAFERCKLNQAEAALGGTFLYITDNFVLNPGNNAGLIIGFVVNIVFAGGCHLNRTTAG